MSALIAAGPWQADEDSRRAALSIEEAAAAGLDPWSAARLDGACWIGNTLRDLAEAPQGPHGPLAEPASVDAAASARAEALFLQPWFDSASRGDLSALLSMIERGARVDALSSSLETAATCACHGGQLGALRILADAGADLSIANGQRWTCAMLAAGSGNVPVLELALEREPSSALAVDNLERTAMHWAAERGHLGAIAALAKAGCPLDGAATSQGLTPLLMACAAGRGDAARLLAKLGAKADAFDRHGQGPVTLLGLALAAQTARVWPKADASRELAAFEELAEAGAATERLPRGGGHSAAGLAALAGSARALRAILASDPASADADSNGKPLIELCVEGGSLPCLLLAISGANGGRPSPDKAQAALRAACSKGHAQMAAELIGLGADPKACGPNGLSAARLAREAGFPECAHAVESRLAAMEAGEISACSGQGSARERSGPRL